MQKRRCVLSRAAAIIIGYFSNQVIGEEMFCTLQLFCFITYPRLELCV